MTSPDTRVAVHTITGFLGSGKTTLLNRLVRDPGMADSAVIVNEFGEVGIDHALVETAHEDAVLLNSGCLCCTLRGDLVDTLRDLAARVDAGALPGFGRVLIETTGLADPGPVLGTLMADPLLVDRYRAGLVVTTVDALNAPGQRATHPEFARQVAAADRIVLTKTDLAAAADRGRSLDVVQRINPGADLLEVVGGVVDPDLLLGGAGADQDTRTEAIERWVSAGGTGQDHGHGHGGSHREDVRAWTIEHDAPVPWGALRAWLESVVSLRGDRLLRIKGLVNVAGVASPVAVHGVQHVLHPPVRLARWPDADRRTRIVMITRGLELRAPGGLLAAACRSASSLEPQWRPNAHA